MTAPTETGRAARACPPRPRRRHDEELELEIDDRAVDDALLHLDDAGDARNERLVYFKHLFRLQRELVQAAGLGQPRPARRW
jgi:hypothetical protein